VLRGVRVKRIRGRLHPLEATSSTNTKSVSPMTVCVGRFASCFKCQSQHGVGELAFLRDSIIDSMVAWLGKRATVYTYHRQPLYCHSSSLSDMTKQPALESSSLIENRFSAYLLTELLIVSV